MPLPAYPSSPSCCGFLLVPAGILVCLDGYMNVAMEQTEEHVDGVLQNKYGDCFIRGNNGKCGCRCAVIATYSSLPEPQKHHLRAPLCCAVLYIATQKRR